jgi:hypothetical protein
MCVGCAEQSIQEGEGFCPACVGDLLAAVMSERSSLLAEVDRLNTWDGLLSILDRYYPADVMERMPNAPGPHLTLLIREAERLKRERRHLARVADWFSVNPPGTPVPEWCNHGWCDGEPVVGDEDLEESEQAAEAANAQNAPIPPG